MKNWLTYNQMTRENSGGKAVELANMKKLGLNVPDFFALSMPVADYIRQTGNTMEVEEELLASLSEVPLYAVRSSAIMEDGNETSFAGLFETFLNVPKEKLGEKILACLRAVGNNHIQDYVHFHEIEKRELGLTVIVQEMVPAEKSGVLFTANPQGLLNESVLIVGNGLGEGVVNAEVPVTTYFLKRDESLIYFEREEDSPQLREEELESLLEQVDGLSEEKLDIEFAVYKGEVFVLQARPITTYPRGEVVVYNNSNLVESYPGLTQPLTESFIKFAYEHVFKGVAWRFSRSQALVASYQSAFEELVVRINGRMYYNMNHLYGLLQFLPFPKLILPIWQEMMGFSQKEVVISHDLEKKTSLWESLSISVRILKELITAPQQMDELNQEFQDTSVFFTETYKADMTADEVEQLYNTLAEQVLTKWDITLVNDLYAFIYTGISKRILRKWGKDPESGEWYHWFSGIPMMSSMEPVIGMQQLMAFVREHDLVEELKQIQTESELALFLNRKPAFAQEFTRYIDKYGDRGLEELKLEADTFRSQPLKAIRQMVDLLDTSPKPITTAPSEMEEPFKGWRKHVFRFVSKRARLGIQHRETSRLNRSRIYGMVRTLFGRLGEIAEQKGLISAHDDVFWLTTEEIFDLKDYHGVIEERKLAQEGFESLPAYGYLVFQGSPYNKVVRNIENARQGTDEKILQGTPTSNGIVEGEILVVHQPNEVRTDAKDKILVTQMTDPGWVFLLTQAKGIIAEKGSLLSHTAIISRELGIPAVVGIKHATQQLQSGEQVILDGNTGQVTRKEAFDEGRTIK
ncbi:PEP/pyruvate-binding domain-containing protein [Jeotgalibaca sp. A122]|uniref:PEP/pyruvate-binding domain-containing protein n=1 Tax=Jeotgalibaca sp. A122 TaxID=3457322 RepID=UPI003FCF2DD7